jgi:hypothetical protein
MLQLLLRRCGIKGTKPTVSKPAAAGELAQGELWLNNNHESPGLFARADDDTLIEFTPEKPFLQDGTNAKPRTYLSKLKDVVSVKDFGAVGDGVADDTAAIQAAIDAASASGSRTVVSLAGDTYRTVGELFIKVNAILKDGTIKFDPSADGKIAINIGTKDGQYPVRVGGVESVVVDALASTRLNLTAFNFGHLARECFVSYCRAEMNNGLPPGTDRNHTGFSIYGVKTSAVVTGSGAYQNTYHGCSAYNCKLGFSLDTAGYGEAGYAPEANANWLSSCGAYSCYTGAVYVGYGAQDNHIEVRADTFVTQTGSGTTIKVCQVLGSSNTIRITEEIGPRADTQYTVAIEGDNARYNEISYSTQQVVTAAILDSTTGGAVGKNAVVNIGRPQYINGGDTLTVSGYASVAAGTITIVNSFVAPKKCILIGVSAQNDLVPASYTRFYFAKNGTIDTAQRLTWDSRDAAHTVKSLDNDPSFTAAIDGRFIYSAGERCVVSIDQDATAGQQIYYTIVFKVLAP